MEKRRKRLARSGWGGDQGMATLPDGVPSLGLSGRGLSQRGFEPLNDSGVEWEWLHEGNDIDTGRDSATAFFLATEGTEKKPRAAPHL